MDGRGVSGDFQVIWLPKQSYAQAMVLPVPHGTLKASLLEAFAAIDWVARPVQTVAAARHVQGASNAAFFLVASSEQSFEEVHQSGYDFETCCTPSHCC